MANDEVLWKEVNDLKERSLAPHKQRAVSPRAKVTAKSERQEGAKKNGRPFPARASNRREPSGRGQSTNGGVDPSVDRREPPGRDQLAGQVVSRPVSFYIPQSVNEKIDEAVDYMQKRHGVKVDRSAVVSAILGEPGLWEPQSLNQLVDKAFSQLTSRLASRLTGAPWARPGR